MLNLLLVDDEKSVLNGLRHILKKHCPHYEIVDMVQSGTEALQVLRTKHVDVVVTDVRMPEMDGIALTEEINHSFPDISVIILSGHADFDYVRQAMKKGAFDYLLKPCHYQTIIDLLAKIEEKAIEKGRETEKATIRLQLELSLKGKREMPADWAADSETALAAIEAKDYYDPAIEHSLLQLANRWGMCSESIFTIVLEDTLVVLFRKPGNMTALKQKLYEFRHSLTKYGQSVFIALAWVTHRPDGLGQSFAACKQMLDFLRFNEHFVVLDETAYAEKMERQKKISIQDYFSGKTVGRCIVGADHNRMHQYIEANMLKLQQLDAYLDPARVKRELLSEFAYLEHELREHRMELETGSEDNYVDRISGFQTFRELIGWLKHYSMSMMMCMNDEEHNPHYIQAALRYIERHYMEDLSLKTVSDTVYLNPWYFSSQFKKYTGLSFSEYLNQVRVRMAKEFLKQKDLKVYQVAEMVGFQDAAYFSTVFKSIEHMSPKDYQRAF
ncbi:response regulator [Paenibacillus thermotolerans]|uniref:response regulator n=1 Tax=Paenibacillus thermotolerans TaxID=3027807 RepID=UPI00236741F7|nr:MULTISPECIES: response regulator [unclassified Paenibacillus]